MTKWELARYLIDAKKNIDSVLYVEKNEILLSNINLRQKVSDFQQQFYINCCIVLDNAFPNKTKELCENATITSIYYERDKFYAHKDSSYKKIKYTNFTEIIEVLKKQLNEVFSKSKDFLPECLTLNHVSHDKELFRLAYRVNPEMERNINIVKYPRGTFHSYQLTEEGQHYFKSLDTAERDRETARIFAYDYDKVIKKEILQSSDDISDMTEKEKQRQAVIIENGLNSYEGLQNRQDACININILFNQNMWAVPNLKEFEKVEELKAIGILDQFEIPHLEKLQNKEIAKKFSEFVEKNKCQN